MAALGGVAIGAGPRGSRHGAVMAGVFDIDLETEEGSDGDEPELGAVSRQRGAGGHRGCDRRRRLGRGAPRGREAAGAGRAVEAVSGTGARWGQRDRGCGG